MTYHLSLNHSCLDYYCHKKGWKLRTSNGKVDEKMGRKNYKVKIAVYFFDRQTMSFTSI